MPGSTNLSDDDVVKQAGKRSEAIAVKTIHFMSSVSQPMRRSASIG